MCRCSLILLALPALALATDKSSCADNPLDAKLPNVQFENTPAVQALASLSQAAHVCFGIENASELRNPISVNTAGLTYLQFVRRIAPTMRVHAIGKIVNLIPRTSPAGNWLDTELILETDVPQDVNWISEWVLGNQLYYLSRPGTKDGIVGSIPAVSVNIGPYPKEVRPARQLLNQLVLDAGGGCWLTPNLWLKRDGPLPTNLWLVLVYRTHPRWKEVLSSFGVIPFPSASSAR